MPTVGYKAPAEQFGARELLEFAIRAEAHGFDAVTVSDHFQPWWHRTAQAPVSVAWLGALADRTQRVRLGTSVLTPALRHEPAVVAAAFGRLARRHPGRVFLGLGTGETRGEGAPLGMDWPPFRERLQRLAESIELMRLLWTQETVTYGGDYVTALRASIPDRLPAPVPIHMAAAGPRGARAAGGLAEGFICKSGQGMDAYRDLLEAVDDGARAAGRDPATIARTIEVSVSYGSSWDSDDVMDQLGRYVDLGFTDVVVHSMGRDQAGFIAAFSRDVLAGLRERLDRRTAFTTGVC